MSEKNEKTTSLDSDIEKVHIETYSVISKDQFVQSDAEKKLVKKINWIFMPFVCCILFIQVNICFYFLSNRKIHSYFFSSLLINLHLAQLA